MRKVLVGFLVLVSCVTMSSQFVSASTNINIQNVESYSVKNNDGWQYQNQKWFYYKDGLMQTGWLNLNGTWYYLNQSGAMQTGWLNLDGTWYYLNQNGAMQTGWLNLGGTWYYLNQNGAMQIGWLNLGGTWYYLNQSGAMQTGWLSLGRTWYYLYSNGVMATNVVIDNWKIDENGVAMLQVEAMSFSSYASSITSLGFTSDGGGFYSYNHSNGDCLAKLVVGSSSMQLILTGYSDGLYSATQTSMNWLIPSDAGRAMSMINSESPGSFESDGRIFSLQIKSGAPVINISNK